MKRSALLTIALVLGMSAIAGMFAAFGPGVSPAERPNKNGIGRSANGNVGVAHGSALLAYDPDDLNNVVNFFDVIFAGRVVEEKGVQKPGNSVIQTQFSVEVLHVLKGDLPNRITVSQEGGFYEGMWHVDVGDISTASPDLDEELVKKYMLQPGGTYLFTARYSNAHGWYTIGSTVVSRWPLDIDPSATKEEARVQSADHPRVQEMEAAVSRAMR